MSWFFIALVGPALWAASNHIDKYLLERYFKGRDAGALIIFSALIGIVLAPFILFIEPNVLDISPSDAFLTILNGILLIVGIIIYLYALKEDETSTVAALFQLVPFFLFALSYLILGETLVPIQIIGGLLIIMGSIGISLELAESRSRFKSKLWLLMSLASLVIALSAVLFKKVALSESFWASVFWGWTGAILVGIFCLIFIPTYRRSFLEVFHQNRASIVMLNILNEIIDSLATIAFRFAGVLAPLALVETVSGFQPVFVFIYGIILTLFFPSLGKESLLRKHIFQKALAIAVMVLGAALVANR